MIRNDSGQKAREQDEARAQIAFLHQKLGTEQGSYDNEKISLEFDDTGGFTPVNILVIDNRVVENRSIGVHKRAYNQPYRKIRFGNPYLLLA